MSNTKSDCIETIFFPLFFFHRSLNDFTSGLWLGHSNTNTFQSEQLQCSSGYISRMTWWSSAVFQIFLQDRLVFVFCKVHWLVVRLLNHDVFDCHLLCFPPGSLPVSASFLFLSSSSLFSCFFGLLKVWNWNLPSCDSWYSRRCQAGF